MNRLYPQVQEVRGIVASYYGADPGDMTTPRKHGRLPRIRQVAMYLCKEVALIQGMQSPRPPSYLEIARRFARDHTTVLYGVRKIRALVQTDASLARELAELRRLIEKARA